MATYFLANHVYICATPDGAVLLDLRKDEYIGMGRSETDALAEIIPAWPTFQAGPSSSDHPRLDPSEVATELLSRNILTTSSSSGKRPELTLCASPEQAVRPPLWEVAPYAIMDVGRAACAIAVARLTLRTIRLERIVERARARKTAGIQRTPVPNGEIIRNAVTKFINLRPFLYTAREFCLFDSLAMLMFLHRFGIYPDWIFGVTTSPFAAHCWLQHGSLVLNSSVEEARTFVPILVV